MTSCKNNLSHGLSVYIMKFNCQVNTFWQHLHNLISISDFPTTRLFAVEKKYIFTSMFTRSSCTDGMYAGIKLIEQWWCMDLTCHEQMLYYLANDKLVAQQQARGQLKNPYFTINSCILTFATSDIVEPALDQQVSFCIQGYPPRVLVAQWVEHPTGVTEVVGSNPDLDSDCSVVLSPSPSD